MLCTACVDESVCAAKEVTATRDCGADSGCGCGLAPTFTSLASTLVMGGFVSGESAAGLPLGLGLFAGSVVFSSSSLELVLAPPVLTTTPGGACEVVDP